MQAGTRVNVEQASKRAMRKPTRLRFGEGRRPPDPMSDIRLEDSAGVVTSACMQEEVVWNTGNPYGRELDSQPGPREGQTGPFRVAERLVVPEMPGNAGGGKGPQFRVNVVRGRVRRVVQT